MNANSLDDSTEICYNSSQVWSFPRNMLVHLAVQDVMPGWLFLFYSPFAIGNEEVCQNVRRQAKW